MPRDAGHLRQDWDTVLQAARLYCQDDETLNLIRQARLHDFDSRSDSVVLQIPAEVSRGEFLRRAQRILESAFTNRFGTKPQIFVENLPAGYRAITPGPQLNTADIKRLTESHERGREEAETYGTSPLLEAADNGHVTPVRRTSTSFNARYTFENFVVGPANELALAASKAVVERPGTGYNPLFVHGSVGLGKTHLLQAICNEMLQRDPTMKIAYLSCETFVNDFIEAVQRGNQHQFRARFRTFDLLVIDDIHFLAGREQTQEEFFHTFNDLYNAGRQIVISSDAAPGDIPELEKRLTSRFMQGLAVKLEIPQTEMREAIVAAKARERGLEIPRDIIQYIANHIRSNVRELEGAVTKVAALAATQKRPLTLQGVRESLRDLVVSHLPQRTTIEDIAEITCRHFGVKLPELQSARRQQSIAVPRQVTMYLAKKHTNKTLNEIGGFFGGRDHTTVLHSIRKIDSALNTDDTMKRTVEVLEASLRNA